jgi:hypothetical protein
VKSFADDTGMCLALRIEQGAADRCGWPRLSVGMDVNLLHQLQAGEPDVDGRSPHRADRAPVAAPRWPGEWIMQYGIRGIRDHQAVLDQRDIARWVAVPA